MIIFPVTLSLPHISTPQLSPFPKEPMCLSQNAEPETRVCICMQVIYLEKWPKAQEGGTETCKTAKEGRPLQRCFTELATNMVTGAQSPQDLPRSCVWCTSELSACEKEDRSTYLFPNFYLPLVRDCHIGYLCLLTSIDCTWVSECQTGLAVILQSSFREVSRQKVRHEVLPREGAGKSCWYDAGRCSNGHSRRWVEEM